MKKGEDPLEPRKNSFRRRRKSRVLKTTKHIACSVAISSLIIGLSSQFVGKTFGAFGDSGTTSSQIKACEVFPGYINERFSDIKEELLLFLNELNNLPDITSYTASFEQVEGLAEYSIQQLKEEEERLKENQIKLEELQNERLELDNRLDFARENLNERAHTIYKWFEKIAQLSEQTTTSCLQDEYPLAGDVLKDLLLKSGLKHSQIENLLFYYHTHQFGQNAAPHIKEAVWENFQNFINETLKSPKNQLEKNKQTMKEEKKKIKEEITSVQAMIKQLEKEEAEKEKEEKQKEAEERKAKKEQEKQKESQKEAAADAFKEKEEVNMDSDEGDKEDQANDDGSSSDDEQTTERDNYGPKDKQTEDAAEKEKSGSGDSQKNKNGETSNKGEEIEEKASSEQEDVEEESKEKE